MVSAVTGYYRDWQSVNVDVANNSGHPLNRVWVECSSPEEQRRQDLGEVETDSSRTIRFPARYEGGSRWKPSFGTSYNIKLFWDEGTGHILESQIVPRNRGSYVEFDVHPGGKVHILAGQVH